MPTIMAIFFIFNLNALFGQNKSKAYAWEQATNGLYINPGNIGIGIISPETALHIHREINLGTDPYAIIRLSINDVKNETHVWDIANTDNLNFKFGTGASTQSVMTLSQYGQLALGTETPLSSAIMQLESTDKGLLLPRLTTAEKNAITSPANGLLVYDVSLQAFSYYDSGVWNEIVIQTTLNNYLTINDFNNSPAGSITNANKTNWNTAYTWGNHATAGYLTSFTETDPVFSAWDKTTGITITESQITDFGTYLTSYTETDPIYTAWNKDYNDLTNKPILFDGQWTSLSGTPPNISTFANDVNYITDGNTNWNNEYGFITNADIDVLWERSKGNTILLNNKDNVGIGTDKPEKAMHIYRSINPFISSATANIRFENYYIGNLHGSGSYVWDFENNRESFKLNFGFAKENEAINTETKFSFTKEGKLIANEYTNTNNDFLISGEGIIANTYSNDNFNVSESGIVSATKFIGDGSELINLNIPEAIWHLDGGNAAFSGDIIIGDGASAKDGYSEFIKIRTNNEDWYIGAEESATQEASGFFVGKNYISDGTFHIKNNGNVGIGTTNPIAKLHVKDGAILLDGDMGSWTNSGWRARIQSPLGTVWASTNKVNTGGNYYLGFGMTNSGWYFMNRKDDNTKRYVCRISQYGDIFATSLKLQQMNWSDFVFAPNYKLEPLKELEEYIKKNKHLPNIPSEKEIETDGLDLGSMQKLQMQKIEELTLYIIEQNKRIKALEEKTGSKQ